MTSLYNSVRRVRYSIMNQTLFNTLHSHLIAYPTPSNLNASWNWGSLAGLCLVLQIVTGVCLAMHYTAHVDRAFASVQHIMRDVPSGWLLRYFHANGASFFFIVVYVHLFRGLYYNSYAQPRELVWLFGVVILLMMILTAFIGYVRPWGQMSLWGATVITSLASALPIIGHAVVAWLWGGFAVDNPTLNRFYSAHYLLPFILAALSLLHLAALHQHGSTNPRGVNAQTDLVDFYPYYTSKDIVGLLIVSVFAVFLVFFYPDILSHPDNNIPANPYSTPAHIQPEWYFLWVYAILRSIPNKLAGVAAVGLVFLSLGSLPYLHKHPVRSAQFRLRQTWLYWTFLADCALLTWIGIMPVEAPYLLMGQLASVWFFLYLLVFLPLSAWLEQKRVTHLEQSEYYTALSK